HPLTPTPVLVSNVNAEAFPDHASLAWWLGGDALSAVAVERRSESGEWREIAAAAVSGGVARYEDRGVAPGARYVYRITYVERRVRQTPGAGWVTIPARAGFALAPPAPNPWTRGTLRASLTLDL